MFLHIGNNVLIRKEALIGIFNINSLMNDLKGKKFYNEMRHNKDVKDISGGKQASIVLTTDGVYISRISSATLQGRSRDSVEEMLSVEGTGEPTETDPAPGPEEDLPIEEDNS